MSTSSGRTSGNPSAGARNLLVACAGVAADDTVLLVVEPQGYDHYEPAMIAFIESEVRALGARVQVVALSPVGGPESIPESLLRAIEAADHTIFLNRIGDQLRFAPLPGVGTKTMSYALDMELLGSDFATTPFAVWEDIQARLTAQLGAARHYTIRCPRGTELTTRSMGASSAQKRAGGFTVGNFPVMIVPPLAAGRLSGKLVLSQVLTSTYIHSYDDSIVPLPTPLTLTVVDGAITHIEGAPQLVARAEAQFARVAGLFGGAQWVINSWHAGINAFTSFSRPALSDIDRWSAVAFGSPRYAHFHMCGNAPGDICGQIFDPTITFDEQVLWANGDAVFLNAEDQRQLQEQGGPISGPLRMRRNIGVAGLDS